MKQILILLFLIPIFATAQNKVLLRVQGANRVDTIYRKSGQDSIFYTINGGIERAIKDSLGITDMSGKLNISDTSAMLSPYLRYAYRTPGVDSIYFVTGAGNILAVKDSTGSGGSGVTTMGAFGSTPNANGGTISGTTLTLQPADATNPGGLSTGTQTIGGIKTFNTQVGISSGTAAAPGLRLSASTQTGIFRSGSNELAISIGGVKATTFRAFQSNSIFEMFDSLGNSVFSFYGSSGSHSDGARNRIVTDSAAVIIWSNTRNVNSAPIRQTGVGRNNTGVIAAVIPNPNNQIGAFIASEYQFTTGHYRSANDVAIARVGTGSLKIYSGSMAAAENSAILDIQSNTKGLLTPRMTQAQRDAIPTPGDGLMIYCNNCLDSGGVNAGVMQVYQLSTTTWKNLY